MSKGPEGQKRPVNVIGCAVKAIYTATGAAEEEYEYEDTGKTALTLGRKGGQPRAEMLCKNRRSQIAKKSATPDPVNQEFFTSSTQLDLTDAAARQLFI